MRKIIIHSICLILFFSMLLILGPQKEKVDTVMLEIDAVKPNNVSQVEKYREEYQNNDIVGVLSIDNIFDKKIVVRGQDNEYYKNHSIKRKEDSRGSIFMDCQIDLNTTRKILLYGQEASLPILKSYINSYFLQEHSNITFITDKQKETYQVFSILVLEEDSFYKKLSFDDEEWANHLTKINEMSIYPIDYEAKKDAKALLLQTDLEDGKQIVIATIRVDVEVF